MFTRDFEQLMSFQLHLHAILPVNTQCRTTNQKHKPLNGNKDIGVRRLFSKE